MVWNVGGFIMLEKLPKDKVAVGAKQVLKAIEAGRAHRVYAAIDAEGFVNRRVLALCREKNLPVIDSYTMKQLGEACQIEVGAACCCLLRD